MDRKRSLKRILAGVMALSMALGMMPINEVDFNVDKNTWVHAKEYSDRHVKISDLQVGDIIRDSVNELECYDDQYALTLKAGGYIERVGFGADRDVTLSKEDYYYIDSRYGLNGRYLPYCNGETAEGWQVVSVDHEAKTLTLTGYSAVQNNNPYTQAVRYCRYDTDGTPISYGTLAANAGILVESDSVKWTNGNTYVVGEDVTISKRIKVTGTVNLILLNGATLTAEKGIALASGNTLNIYAQKEGTGALIATASGSDAGIGGTDTSDEVKTCGTLNIYGGQITATTGRGWCAGIGGGFGKDGGTVTIYRGNVTATGGDYSGSGIGAGGDSGNRRGKGGTVKIYGGTVTTTGKAGGMGIGAGNGNPDNGTLILGKDVALYGNNDSMPAGEENTDKVDTTVGENVSTRNTYMKVVGPQTTYEDEVNVFNNPTVKTNLLYTGSAQELVSALEWNGEELGIVYYGIKDEDTITWGDAGVLPTAEDVGTYTVYFKIISTNANFNDLDATEIGDVVIGKVHATVSNGADTTYYGSLSDALAEWTDGTTLTLLEDSVIDSTISVTAEKTLDLNGHGIKMTGVGSVINVGDDANLTINDSNPDAVHYYTIASPASNGAGLAVVDDINTEETRTFNGGYITGGNATNGGGININKGGSVTMNGGAVIGNNGTNECGGVNITQGAKMTMNGGYIIGNSAPQGGAGVNARGIFVMTDGTIAYNYASSRAGGIGEGKLVLHGAPVIRDNYSDVGKDNVYVIGNSDYHIIVNDEMTNTTPIGVRLPKGVSVFTINETTDHNDETKFNSDDENFVTGKNADGQLFLGEPFDVSFDVNGHGSSPDNVTVASGSLITEPVVPTESGWTFDGWYKEAECTNAWDFKSDIVSAATDLYAKWTAVPATAATISTQPSDLSLTYGYTSGSVSVTATVATGHTLGYQWYKNTTKSSTGGTAISGANDDCYNIPGGNDAGITEYYYCVITAKREDNDQITTINSDVATVTVGKAAIAPEVSIANWTYGEKASEPSVANNPGKGEVTYTYYKGEEKLDGVPTSAGTYTVEASIAETDNYKAGSASKKFTIARAEIAPVVSITGWTYGETAKDPSVTKNSGNGAVTYTYYKGEEKLDGVPTSAGTYTVKASVAETSNYTAGSASREFTVAKRSLKITADKAGKVYGTDDPALTYSVEGTLVGEDKITGSLSREKGDNTGEYKIGQGSLTAGDNYEVEFVSDKFTITPAEFKVKASGYSGAYDGKDHGIAVSADVEDAKICYLVSETEPTEADFTEDALTESPKYKNTGTYKIWYCITSPNYSTVISYQTVEITKAAIAPKVSLANWTYGEKQGVPKIEGLPENTDFSAGVTYYKKGSDKALGTEPTDAGEYTVVAVIDESANYLGGEAEADFSIAKAEIKPSVTIEGWKNGETANKPVVTGNAGNASVKFEYMAKDAEDGKLSETVPTAVGIYVVKASVAETANYKAGSATAEFTIEHGHSYSDKWSYDESKHWRECTSEEGECDAQKTDVAEHTFTDWKVTKKATCEEAGTESRKCTVCGKEETRPVEATGHHFGEWEVTKQPTCTEKGVQTRYCADCDAFETKEIPATGHKYGTPVYTWSEDGKTCTATVTCENDKTHVITEKAVITSAVKTEATCDKAGVTTYTATFKNEVFSAQTKDVTDIPATGHKYGKPVYTWSEDGKTCTATITCENDKTHVITEKAVITGTVKTAATCDKNGVTTYTAKFENELFSAQTKDVEDIPATNHKFGKPEYTWSADGKSCTATVICETDKKFTVTEEAKITSAVKTAATCENKGVTTYTASFKNERY